MTINVQGNKVLNKRLYKQDLSGELYCDVTFTGVEPGLYLAVATIIPACDGNRWGPENINGTCDYWIDMCLFGAHSFTNVVNVTSTSNVSIPLCGCMMCGWGSDKKLEVQSGSVVFLKQL